MEPQFKEDTDNTVWKSIQKTLHSSGDASKAKDPVFSSYKVPVLNIKKEKAESKDLKSKRKAKEEAEAKKSKKLPYYAKDRIYERELKIIAVDEIVRFLNKYNSLIDEEKERKKVEAKIKLMNRKSKKLKKQKPRGDKVLND